MSRPALTPTAHPGAAALAPPAYALPALPRRGERRDGLSPGQRRLMVGAILTAHAAAVWGLLQVREVRDAVADVAPMFVSLIAPPKPPEPVVPPPPPQAQPAAKKVPLPMIAAAPSPAPAVFETPAPPPVVPEPAPPVVVAAAPAPVPAPPAPPAPPKVIPASDVQYLEPIEIVYPRLSIRMGETGTVIVRLLIDPAGMPRDVQISRSSGSFRLDDAAVAAVRKARFRPPTENGQPVYGVTSVPVKFELEK